MASPCFRVERAILMHRAGGNKAQRIPGMRRRRRATGPEPAASRSALAERGCAPVVRRGSIVHALLRLRISNALLHRFSAYDAQAMNKPALPSLLAATVTAALSAQSAVQATCRF
jgi:hypothetical protein